MTNEVKCKHYDEENGWCKKLSDWSDPMPHIVYCPKSPCEYAEPIEQVVNNNDIIKELDILDKFEFFGGQRAGRLLWFNKPADIQEKDIGEFNRDIDFLKAFINRQKAEIERLQKYNTDMARKHYNDGIKECAEKTDKIITEIYNKFIFGDYDLGDEAIEAIMDFCVDISHDIDNLVKEMTEEQE